MESFSLLKYWKALAPGGANARSAPGTDTGTAGSGNNRAAETDDEGDDGGPFIDLEFAVPDENEADEEDDEDDEDDDGSANVVVSDCTDGEEREVRLGLSSDAKDEDLFINGCSLVPLDSNSKHQLIPVSLLKSATKLRIFMLRFKKSKTVASANKADSNGSAPKSDGEEVGEKQKTRKELSGGGGGFFTVKFKVEEVPIVSLFTRDNSSKKQSVAVTAAEESASDDKRSMQKYFRMVKPLGEKLRFSGQLKGAEATAKNESESEVCGSATATATATAATAVENAKSVKHGNIQAGLRVVYKHLGKSRSASSAAATPVSTAAVAAPSRRRDDSLLEQQDGIQSAILHCKRSFNGSRDSASGTNALLSRSSSDPSHGKSTELERDSSEETSSRPATN